MMKTLNKELLRMKKRHFPCGPTADVEVKVDVDVDINIGIEIDT